MKKFLILMSVSLLVISFVLSTPYKAKADTLEETINKELQGLDLSALEDFYNSLPKSDGNDFYTVLNGFINGTYLADYNGIKNYIGKLLLDNFLSIIPALISIVIVAIIFSLSEQLKGRVITDGVKSAIRTTCVLAIIVIFSKELAPIFQNVKNIIENISKLNEIMSPIMLSLIVASGGTVTASIYSPTVVFLSNGFVNIVLLVLLPLVSLIAVFGALSCLSEKIKLSKFSDFFSSTFKWVVGISVTVSSLFLTAQGINSSIIDGVSVKAAKYAISNSVPLIGGFLRDGFDIVTSGTIIIKNVIGITGVIALFYLLLSPILRLIAFSLAFKFVSAIIEPFSDGKISTICTVSSKTITYLIICVLITALMFFLTILVLMISSSAFI